MDIKIDDAAPTSDSLMVLMDPSRERVFSWDGSRNSRPIEVENGDWIVLAVLPADTVADEVESWLAEHEERLEEIAADPDEGDAVRSLGDDLEEHLREESAVYSDAADAWDIDVRDYLGFPGTLDELVAAQVREARDDLDCRLHEGDVGDHVSRKLLKWLDSEESENSDHRVNVLRLLGMD